MPDQHRRHPSTYSTPELPAVPRLERLGITQQFIALKCEVETMRSYDSQGGQS